MGERMLERDGVRLCAETFGDPAHPAVLLVAGGAQSMVWWESGFCRRLAHAGRFVVRYDQRGTGLSSGAIDGELYDAADLAEDPVRVLDGLGVAEAHLVGLSMGGAVAQVVALRHPDRVLTLTLVATTAAHDLGGPALPPPAPQVAASFAEDAPEPDWADRDAVVAYRVDAERPFVGRLGLDEARVRRLAELEVDRTPDMRSAMSAPPVHGDAWPEGATLRDLDVPTLVVHGTDDPMFPLDHGRALSAAIPGARLVELPGVGHEQPPPTTWDLVVAELVRHTAPR